MSNVRVSDFMPNTHTGTQGTNTGGHCLTTKGQPCVNHTLTFFFVVKCQFGGLMMEDEFDDDDWQHTHIDDPYQPVAAVS